MDDKKQRFSNQQLADIFNLIADLLEIKGEIIFKTLAYRKAADSLANLSRPAYDIWKEGKLTDIPGVGKAINDKIGELFTTGKLAYLERLENEVPISLIDLLKIPGVGKKKVALFWKELGITTLEELKQAASQGKLSSIPGMGAKSEQKIIAGIEALSRRTGRTQLGKAWMFAQEISNQLRSIPDVVAVEPAGSLRRMRETVGDLDLLAAAKDSTQIMDVFTNRPDIVEVLGKGETKSSVEFENGFRAQLWVHPPERFGTALQYATGSKDHNVRLRELAISQGLSLSEHAFLRKDGTEILCAREKDVYRTLGIPWIPPELREDHGEIQAALEGKLPHLIEISDILAELHSHSTWSDGKATTKEMAVAAIVRGYQILAITDHSKSLGIAGGLSEADLKKQRCEIDTIQQELGNSIILLQGAEVEIRADGTLDFPDEVLADLDIVIASLHTSLRQPREQITQRLIKAINNPHVDIIGHPTGRKILERNPADLDMEQVLRAAAKTNTALEINAHPSRLDLNDINARRAVELGVLLSINTDAHAPEDLDMLRFGVATARRGWVESQNVINTWKPNKLIQWLKTHKGQ
ncbi:MAG: DNA polymerase/3'-5' exonuclease PolX [Anaerolineales bacterium]|nr:DNA polymerase/3'-5' exonuclease PolX [Anaerolineales bacterium]